MNVYDVLSGVYQKRGNAMEKKIAMTVKMRMVVVS